MPQWFFLTSKQSVLILILKNFVTKKIYIINIKTRLIIILVENICFPPVQKVGNIQKNCHLNNIYYYSDQAALVICGFAIRGFDYSLT